MWSRSRLFREWPPALPASRGRRWAAVASPAVDLDDGVRECLRCLLREVVPDAAGDGVVRVGAGESGGVGPGFGVGGAVGVAFEGDRGHGDGRAVGEASFEVVEPWF